MTSHDPYCAPSLASAALITVDVQRCVLDGQPAEVPGTSVALPAMAELVTMFREIGRPIVHMVRLYLPDGSNVDPCRRRAVQSGSPMFLAGSAGSQLAPELLPHNGVRLRERLLLAGSAQEISTHEIVLYKPRWGAFYETSLADHLQRQAIDTIVFCGCNFPNCPRTSIYEASERDYRLVLARDAISCLDEQGVAELEGIGVSVWSTHQILAELRLVTSRSAIRNDSSGRR